MPALLEQFQGVGRDLYAAGLVSSHGGNLSVRGEGGAVVITRHSAMLGHLEERDLVTLAPGQAPVLSGAEGPASEPSLDTALHQAIYQSCPQARAVVHAHPRHAIALSFSQQEIVPRNLEGRHYLGAVPVVEAAALAEALREHPIAVVAGHGSYARGGDLWEALQWTSVLEESAQVLWLLSQTRLGEGRR